MAISIVGLIVLLLVPAFLAGIIILLIKGGPGIRCFFGILLLLLVIGIFGLFSIKVVSHQPSGFDQSSPPQAQVQGGTVHIDKNPTVWAEGLEEELIPDVYSGLETAAYGLGVQLRETIDKLPQLPKRITILENGIDNIALLERFRRGLQYVIPDSDILIASNMSSETQTEGNIWITINHQQDPPGKITIPEINNANHIQVSQALNVGNQRGSLQAIIQTIDNKFVKQVEYDSRSWLQDVETFRSRVGRGQWAVVTSDETAITKEQARQELYNNATKYVYEYLSAAGPLKQNLLQSDLTTYGLIVDEYDQRFQGLSGPIWRAAMLLDVSPERIQSLQRHQINVHQTQRRTWALQIFSLVGMLILISVLYLFINTITKGYYSTTILVVAVTAFLLFLFLFLV